eukprot:TRINITY_DN31677_c0_g1_i1.p1 TRINITY_DN31677_c0_g1~~TRINITY_DN31677_c0_g1_i1.p1  ORF type:complete len:111 (+),score=24.92 TRINITY_DN31677_c0_g1_i1:102-434(+)
MADAHFSEYILTHYPHPTSSSSTSYPCAFPNCSKILNSGALRVKHLGSVHNQVDLCMAMPRLVEKAKEAAENSTDMKKQDLSQEAREVCLKIQTVSLVRLAQSEQLRSLP